MNTTRREVLSGLTLSTSLMLSASAAGLAEPLQPQEPSEQKRTALAPAYQGQHAVVPLPFDPKKLKGISEALIVSHHDNNYGGAVRNLNKVEAALAAIDKDTPGFVVAGLKDRELSFANSAALHELYFANLGGDGKAAGEVTKAIGETYGSLGRWEEEFRATGAGLAGGSGWVVLDCELGSKALRIHAGGNHTQASAVALPLLVMDMYEHAYQMDYGAAAAKYIDAFFENLRWEDVERRFQRALKACQALQD
jgi:superoxide dismutase, Fe-Mn family